MFVVVIIYTDSSIERKHNTKMFRNLRKISLKRSVTSIYIPKCSFLTNNYKCTDAWNSQISTPILTTVNLNDFYSILDQNHASKGVISAIDVDIFANAINDPSYLEELKSLLHKLRLSAETKNTLESTHHATVRKFIEFDHIPELVDMLKDPLNFGLFLDDYTANILLDKLIVSENYDLAAEVASLIMLQEDYTNDITCTLCQYACYKYIIGYTPLPEPTSLEEKTKKVEEIKIRVKFLRNPYFDDHFDIKDTLILSGKTLAWISERAFDSLNNNLQIIGWLIYKKYEKLLVCCENFSKTASFKIHSEVIDLLNREHGKADDESKTILESCISLLSAVSYSEVPLEESLKISIENAINKTQNKDISQQNEVSYTILCNLGITT